MFTNAVARDALNIIIQRWLEDTNGLDAPDMTSHMKALQNAIASLEALDELDQADQPKLRTLVINPKDYRVIDTYRIAD